MAGGCRLTVLLIIVVLLQVTATSATTGQQKAPPSKPSRKPPSQPNKPPSKPGKPPSKPKPPPNGEPPIQQGPILDIEGPPPGAKYDTQSIIVKYSSDGPPIPFDKPVGQGLGLKFGVLRVRPNETPQEAVARVSKLPFVEYAELNTVHTANTRLLQQSLVNDPSYAVNQWNFRKIGSEIAWQTVTGAKSTDLRPVVCVIDTGIDYNHPDLKSNIYTAFPKGYSAVNGVKDAQDKNGHGSHVSGVIGAATNNGVGVAGINWKANIAACKFIGTNGGYISDAIECLDWCVTKARAQISSNSWGGGAYSQSLKDSIDRAGAAGHLFVAAAGNNGYDLSSTVSYPASYDSPNVLVVGATGAADGRCSFSNYNGPTDIYAPGCDNIYSTYMFGTYATLQGTSQACPHVSGAAALLYTASNGKLPMYAPNGAPSAQNILINTATVTSDGLRRLDLGAAVAQASLYAGRGWKN